MALGGSLLLDFRATILDAAPFGLGAAILLCFYTPRGPRAARVAEGIQVALIILALGLGLACLSYICAAANLPLRDAEMIWIDRHLGFDWLQAMSGLDNHPGFLMVLDGAYATFTCQLVVTALVLLVAKRMRDLDRFFITFVCASLIAEIASVLVPTLGPMPVLADHVQFAHLPTLGRTTADIVLALRQGTLKTIDLAAVDGIISFPSLHAAVAVLVPFALRWNRPLFWPVAMLNALMLVSAIPSGNHYLIDIIGGVAVAGLAILCGRALQTWLDRLTMTGMVRSCLPVMASEATPSRSRACVIASEAKQSRGCSRVIASEAKQSRTKRSNSESRKHWIASSLRSSQ